MHINVSNPIKARLTLLSGDKADDVTLLAKQFEFLTGRKPTSLEMKAAAANLDFEKAASIRDEIKRLRNPELGLPGLARRA